MFSCQCEFKIILTANELMYARSQDGASLKQEAISFDEKEGALSDVAFEKNQKTERCQEVQKECLEEEGAFVSSLHLSCFRNYPFLRIALPEKTPQVVLTGKNGVGKTNLLEAISLLAPGKGLRQAPFSEILNKEEKNTTWGVSCVLQKKDEEIELGTDFEVLEGKRGEKRRVRINGAVGGSQAELGRICSAVWLTPSMDRIFCADPSFRRRFLDRFVQAFFQTHASDCAAYHQALRQWNALIKEGVLDEAWLQALEKTLGKYGAKISNSRRKTVTFLQTFLEKQTQAFPRATISLISGLEDELCLLPKSQQVEFLETKFSSLREVCAQKGSVKGVHTVDFLAHHHQKNMTASLCSTGEQKALLVALLLAHIRAQSSFTKTLPLVLLDEITAHLDSHRNKALLEELATLPTQIWLTGTNETAFNNLKETAHFIAVDTLQRQTPQWAVAS